MDDKQECIEMKRFCWNNALLTVQLEKVEENEENLRYKLMSLEKESNEVANVCSDEVGKLEATLKNKTELLLEALKGKE